MDPIAIGVLCLVLAGMGITFLCFTPRDSRPAKIKITCDAKGCTTTLKVDPEIFRDAQQVVTHSTLTGAQWIAVPVVTPAGQPHGVRTFCPFHSGGQS